MTNQSPMTLPVYSDQAISRMFCDYVDSTNCKERHTAAAVRDYDVFADYVENETLSSNTVQNALLEKAMDFAVEYEESGFIAGFRWAVMMFLHGAPEPPAEAPERASEPPTRKLQPEPAKPAPASSAPLLRDVEDDRCVDKPVAGCITTKQIAELFSTSNFKVVRRIDERIMPYLDSETRKNFQLVRGFNSQHKKTTFYRLNRTACELYLEEISKYKKLVNIAGGCGAMQELVAKVFPGNSRKVPG